MMNKRGVIGGFTVTFVATIVIVAILVIFVLGSSAIKKLDSAESGISIYGEEDVGINITEFENEQKYIANFRFNMAKGSSVEESLARSRNE